MKKAKLKYSLNSFSDDILHRIFSFLEFKDVAALRAVSRRFRTLSISAPSFSFSQHPPCSCKHVSSFMKKLQRQRPQNLKIDQLSFSSLCMDPKHSELHKRWLGELIQAWRVDDLSLEHNLPSIFTCLTSLQSLKILKLNMTKPIHVKLPDEMKLASVERLHLENIQTQDIVGCWVSHSFPSLKSVLLSRLTCVSTNKLDLTVGSSCLYLEDLTIEMCCGFQPVRIITHTLLGLSYTDCTIHNNFGYFCDYCDEENGRIPTEVCAPNLQRLDWKGAPGINKTFKNLHVATITRLNFHYKALLPQFFEAMRWAEILCVDSHTIKYLYEEPLISFREIRYLELQVQKVFCNGNTRDVLTHFLGKFSNLETLILAPCYGDEGAPVRRPFSFEIALKECRKIRWWKIRGLKKVKIRIESMYHAMALMIGMLKKSCPDMEEMTLIYPSAYHESIKSFLDSVESASSKLSIKLNPPNNRKRKRYLSQYNSVDSLRKRR